MVPHTYKMVALGEPVVTTTVVRVVVLVLVAMAHRGELVLDRFWFIEVL